MTKFLQHRLLRGFIHILGGNTLAMVAQGLQFFLLARVLGPTEFGQVGTASAVAALLLPYSGMGAANVMVMHAARDQSLLPCYFGNALIVMAFSGVLLTAFGALVVAPLIGSGFDPMFMLIFGASEILAAKLVDICWHAFAARDEMRPVSVLLSVQSMSRLVTAVLYAVLSAHPHAREWGYCALASNLVVGVALVTFTIRIIGRPRYDIAMAIRNLRVGAAFAVGLSAKGFYTDADKVFLARFTNPATVATYTMAYRILQVALVPTRALSFALTARMYRAGESGLIGALVITRRLIWPLMAFGAVLSVGCYVCAPLLPLIAGDKYIDSIDVLRVLALLPAVALLQSLLADTLSSSGYHTASAICQLIAGIAISAISIFLIPGHGWRGASIASYASQVLLCIMLGVVMWRANRREHANVQADLARRTSASHESPA
jgi:O-antigen/teichoic acid export membrane protein